MGTMERLPYGGVGMGITGAGMVPFGARKRTRDTPRPWIVDLVGK